MSSEVAFSELSIFEKVIYVTEERRIEDVEREIALQEKAAMHGYAPKIFSVEKGSDFYAVQMERINGMSLADLHTDDFDAVPSKDIEEVRRLLQLLLDEEDIVYLDITGYNFMKELDGDGRIFVIDFGDAKMKRDATDDDSFLIDFLSGRKNEWNPEFA